MAALMQLLTESIGWRVKEQTRPVREAMGRTSHAGDDQQPQMVGEYFADYSELTEEELAASDPQADAIIARSIVVSSKRL
jgi:hypothetical protein